MSQIDVFEEKHWLNGRLKYRYLNKEGTEAEAVEYYDNGQLKYRYLVKIGEIHGSCKIWYEDGRLQCEEKYVNGRLHGLKQVWHPNGVVQAEINYRGGYRDGSCRYWYENGKPQEISIYVNGDYSGTRTTWYPNGSMQMQCHYRNGRLHGTEKEWSEDGKLQSSKAYTDGMQIPVWVNNLLASGTLKAEHILRIGNTAVRRFCLEALGYSRFLAQMKHEVVEKEGDQELVKIDWIKREEPICLVKVKCPSTGAFYTLRVPPKMKTVKEAVAWTFGVDQKVYNPEAET